MTAIHFAPGYKTLCGRSAPEPQGFPDRVTCARCRESFRRETAVGVHVWALEADNYGKTLSRAHVAQLYRAAAAKRDETIARAREAVEDETAEQAKCAARANEIDSEGAKGTSHE